MPELKKLKEEKTNNVFPNVNVNVEEKNDDLPF